MVELQNIKLIIRYGYFVLIFCILLFYAFVLVYVHNCSAPNHVKEMTK